MIAATNAQELRIAKWCGGGPQRGADRAESRVVSGAEGGLQVVCSTLALPSDATFGRSFDGVARYAQGLPIVLAIPERGHVTSMIDDVVDHVGCRHHAKRLAHPAQRMLSQVRQAGTLPLPTIPTLGSGQPFAPCVRVEHLHRLRAHLLGTSGLHGDAGLSHESSGRVPVG